MHIGGPRVGEMSGGTSFRNCCLATATPPPPHPSLLPLPLAYANQWQLVSKLVRIRLTVIRQPQIKLRFCTYFLHVASDLHFFVCDGGQYIFDDPKIRGGSGNPIHVYPPFHPPQRNRNTRCMFEK